MALAESMFLVGFETWLSRTGAWWEPIVATVVLAGCALLVGWGAARAPCRPILAGFLFWLGAFLATQ